MSMIPKHVVTKMIDDIITVRNNSDLDLSDNAQIVLGHLWDALEANIPSSNLMSLINLAPADARDNLPKWITDTIMMSDRLEAEWDRNYLEISRYKGA